jgi:hypothetical protein
VWNWSHHWARNYSKKCAKKFRVKSKIWLYVMYSSIVLFHCFEIIENKPLLTMHPISTTFHVVFLSSIVRMMICLSGIQCISYDILSILCFFPFRFRFASLM